MMSANIPKVAEPDNERVSIIKEVSISGSCEMTTEVTRQYKLLDILLHARIGDTVYITLERDGEIKTVEFLITAACISNS